MEIGNIRIRINSLTSLDELSRYEELLKISQQFELNRETIDSSIYKELCTEILKQITSLRYALAYNKATESNTGNLDKNLAYLALKFGRETGVKQDLINCLNDILYFETNEDNRAKIQNEITNLK